VVKKIWKRGDGKKISERRKHSSLVGEKRGKIAMTLVTPERGRGEDVLPANTPDWGNLLTIKVPQKLRKRGYTGMCFTPGSRGGRGWGSPERRARR